MANENTSRRRRNRGARHLEEEDDHLRRRLASLSRASHRISSNLDPTTVLQDIVDAACDLISARYGALAVFDSSGSIQQFVTRGITEAERERVGGIPQGKGLLGLLQTVQKPLRLSDLSTHPQSVDFPPHHPAMKSFLGAPIRDEEEHLGNLYLTEKDGAIEFTEEDEDLIVMFASQAAMAIRNARQFLAL